MQGRLTLNLEEYSWPQTFCALYLLEETPVFAGISEEILNRYEADRDAVENFNSKGMEVTVSQVHRAVRLNRGLTRGAMAEGRRIAENICPDVRTSVMDVTLMFLQTFIDSAEVSLRLLLLDREGLPEMVQDVLEEARSYQKRIAVFLPECDILPLVARLLRKRCRMKKWVDIIEWIEACLSQEEGPLHFRDAIYSLTGEVF